MDGKSDVKIAYRKQQFHSSISVSRMIGVDKWIVEPVKGLLTTVNKPKMTQLLKFKFLNAIILNFKQGQFHN